jgi:hypothetical protein
MNYFVPTLQQVSNFSLQTTFQEKLGGLPFGLPIEMYPICKECSNPMSFVAQFAHNKERLDLGKEKRILYIFVCNYEDVDYSVCQSWDAGLGANACIIIEPETFTNKEIKINVNVQLINEFIVTDWQEFDDEISEKENHYFLDTQKHNEIEFTQFVKLLDKTVDNTRLGSVPYWIQYPEIPDGNYKFIGQLDSKNGFEFGDIGIGYIFVENVKSNEELPKAKFLWQCS